MITYTTVFGVSLSEIYLSLNASKKLFNKFSQFSLLQLNSNSTHNTIFSCILRAVVRWQLLHLYEKWGFEQQKGTSTQ